MQLFFKCFAGSSRRKKDGHLVRTTELPKRAAFQSSQRLREGEFTSLDYVALEPVLSSSGPVPTSNTRSANLKAQLATTVPCKFKQQQRDALVLGCLPAMITIFSLDGKIVHQNPQSRLYYGDRVGDPAHAFAQQAAQQEPGDILALLFVFEPAKKLRMHEVIEAQGLWKAVVRVPSSLNAADAAQGNVGEPLALQHLSPGRRHKARHDQLRPGHLLPGQDDNDDHDDEGTEAATGADAAPGWTSSRGAVQVRATRLAAAGGSAQPFGPLRAIAREHTAPGRPGSQRPLPLSPAQHQHRLQQQSEHGAAGFEPATAPDLPSASLAPMPDDGCGRQAPAPTSASEPPQPRAAAPAAADSGAPPRGDHGHSSVRIETRGQSSRASSVAGGNGGGHDAPPGFGRMESQDPLALATAYFPTSVASTTTGGFPSFSSYQRPTPASISGGVRAAAAATASSCGAGSGCGFPGSCQPSLASLHIDDRNSTSFGQQSVGVYGVSGSMYGSRTAGTVLSPSMAAAAAASDCPTGSALAGGPQCSQHHHQHQHQQQQLRTLRAHTTSTIASAATRALLGGPSGGNLLAMGSMTSMDRLATPVLHGAGGSGVHDPLATSTFATLMFNPPAAVSAATARASHSPLPSTHGRAPVVPSGSRTSSRVVSAHGMGMTRGSASCGHAYLAAVAAALGHSPLHLQPAEAAAAALQPPQPSKQSYLQQQPQPQALRSVSNTGKPIGCRGQRRTASFYMATSGGAPQMMPTINSACRSSSASTTTSRALTFALSLGTSPFTVAPPLPAPPAPPPISVAAPALVLPQGQLQPSAQLLPPRPFLDDDDDDGVPELRTANPPPFRSMDFGAAAAGRPLTKYSNLPAVPRRSSLSRFNSDRMNWNTAFVAATVNGNANGSPAMTMSTQPRLTAAAVAAAASEDEGATADSDGGVGADATTPMPSHLQSPLGAAAAAATVAGGHASVDWPLLEHGSQLHEDAFESGEDPLYGLPFASPDLAGPIPSPPQTCTMYNNSGNVRTAVAAATLHSAGSGGQQRVWLKPPPPPLQELPVAAEAAIDASAAGNGGGGSANGRKGGEGAGHRELVSPVCRQQASAVYTCDAAEVAHEIWTPLVEGGCAEERRVTMSAAMTVAAAAGGECWHEVWSSLMPDPVTGKEVIVITQTDVTAKVIAERHLALVMETEHRLVEQLFPRHILQYITEEWTAAEAEAEAPTGLAGASAVGGGTSGADPAAEVAAPVGPRQRQQLRFVGRAGGGGVTSNRWRPVIRDCTSLATSHSEVTLLFADIKGFTPMCKEVEPRQTMTLLNELYSRYDALLDKYGVYKVETIGDCYFVAGGLIREDEDGMAAVCDRSSRQDPLHAERVFGFAKAMLSAARQVLMPTSGQPVEIRVGLHTGPVVSGVVGTRMPRFCLFGDTVNTASRMESTGAPGAVHASEATLNHLPAVVQAQFKPTGGIEPPLSSLATAARVCRSRARG